MAKVERLKIPTYIDERGDLSVIELKDYVEWEAKRIYYVTSVKGNRGGHAVRGEKKIYVCMQGACLARIHDGVKWHEFEMKGPDDGLIMKDMCWREFEDFSSGTVLMAISNVNYLKDDYIFDIEEFIKESQLRKLIPTS